LHKIGGNENGVAVRVTSRVRLQLVPLRIEL